MGDKMSEVMVLLTRIVALQPVDPGVNHDNLFEHDGGNANDTFDMGIREGNWQAAQIALEALKLFAPSAVLAPKVRFEHDCEKCTFLGNDGEHDLYFCMQMGSMPTVIARYGNGGPDYASGLGTTHPSLQEGERRAREKGLLK
jgi:hypothetical protein